MRVKPILWTARKRQDGTCAIKLYLSHNAKHTYYALDLYCREKDWDEKNHQVRKSNPLCNVINARIVSEQMKFTSLGVQNMDTPLSRIIELYEGKTGTTENLIAFAEHFANECKDGKIKRSYNTWKKYFTVINHLKTYNPNLKFSDINKHFYDTFTSYLRNDLKHQENSVGGAIKIIKVFMNEANERGITQIQEHKKKYFKTVSEETDEIYLTEDEIEKIINLDLTQHPSHAEERDRFIVAYFLLLRWSDSIRISAANFEEKNIKGESVTIFKQRNQKTGIEVYVPVKKIVKDICERNNYYFNLRPNGKANDKLKKIGEWALIDEVIEMDGRTHDKKIGQYNKYKFISTHCSRRSRASNLWLAGVAPKTIKEFGGWEKIETMMKYIRVSKLDNAIRMASHPAFT